MNSLVLSQTDVKKFEKDEIIFVLEKFYYDFLRDKKIKNEIKILPPSCSIKSERIIAFNICEDIYNNILKDLSQALNNLHNINFSYRIWEIIFGNWLRYYVWISFERYNSLINATNKIKFDKIYGIKDDDFIFANNDTSNITYSSIDDRWNSNLYYKVLKYTEFDKDKIFFSDFPLFESEGLKIKSKKKNLPKKIFEKFLNCFSFLQSKNDAVIINSYLPPVYEKLLELLLFQIPKNWKFNDIKYKIFNSKLRSSINLDIGNEKNLQNFIKSNIKEFLPISVVESFNDILKEANNSGLPKNPKFIFTSVDYDNNEIFKFYTAKLLKEKKINYIIGQHGNTYFTDLRTYKHRSELKFCDKFLTWGHSQLPKANTLFNFSSYGRKKYKRQNKKKLLIIVSPIEFKIWPYCTMFQVESGFNNVLEILKFAHKDISSNAIVRLDKSYNSLKGRYYLNKYFMDKSLRIEMGEKSFVKARCNSRLTFFNYDSTGILENLALNYPTICMWDNLEDNINDQFLFKYQTLIKAKILFLNKIDLVKHLNIIWNNIDEWWFSEDTQKYINLFNKDFNNPGNYSSLFKLKKICLEKNEKNIF